MSTDTKAETALLEAYYACFARRDYRGMAACLHPAVSFKDPVFNLKGKGVAAMWHMLCEGGRDMSLTASGIKAGEGEGEARWVADYTFSATGRKVRNVVDSRFRFKDAKIFSQRDSFNFWRWSGQALGWPGYLLGWMPRLQQNVQRRAGANLDKFILAHQEYAEP
jgi:ketosteroid isomerase-like protein